ncbi:amidophosphoribosyltransferase [Candidatus Peregrinibacteria bacterium RIFOXYB2_FULL_32_7]|nr:MAG: amidophosphoribosyltransferase [Candidatus Peregrinibacteria bacterium RIFOXYB2_FULL_32_7]
MCGIIGITAHNPVVQDMYDGLIMLQHRGQDAAGIMTYDMTQFHLHKGDGLLRDIFNERNIAKLKGNFGIGHVRYPTAGVYSSEESQPFLTTCPFGIALVHNGNVTNIKQLKKEIIKDNIRYLNTKSDSELILNILADEILKIKKLSLKPNDFFKALTNLYQRVKGAYSVIGMIADHGLFAFRDPYAIRPLILGEKNALTGKEYCLASESVAFDCLGFKKVRDIKAGEGIFIDLDHNLFQKQCAEPKWNPCIFEYVYLARPDSMIDDISVYKARYRMGQKLAEKIKKANIEIDTVIPVPDSSRSAALGLSDALGIKYREGLVKNRYIGRTFIMAGQKVRKKSVRYKLNPIELEIRNRNILIVDDSIVRGNTSKKIIEMIRETGAKKVYFASSAPEIKHPCVYGVDMPSRKEFIATDLNTEEIAKAIGADMVFYQDIDDLKEAVAEGNKNIPNFCMACMNGKYPTPEVTEKMLNEADIERSSEKQNAEDETWEKEELQPKLL